MKKAVLLLIIVFIYNSVIATQNIESTTARFIDAKPGEWWRIDDEWTRLYNRPILVRNEERGGYPLYFLLNKYTPLFCTPHLVDPLVPQYKCVYIMETRGYLGRWKHIKYCRTDEDGRIIEQEPGFWIVRGWILGTEVWKAKKVRESKQQNLPGEGLERQSHRALREIPRPLESR